MVGKVSSHMVDWRYARILSTNRRIQGAKRITTELHVQGFLERAASAGALTNLCVHDLEPPRRQNECHKRGRE